MAEKNILESIIDYIKPKAHDAIDSITQQWEESQKNSKFSQITDMPPKQMELIQGLVMGGLGGGGKNILSKIKARNALARRNLKPGAPVTGQQTLKPEDAKYFADEIQKMTSKGYKTRDFGKEGANWGVGTIGSGLYALLLNAITDPYSESPDRYGELEGEVPNIGLPPKQR